MLTEEQIEQRKLGIGGSDVAAIAGISGYSTPLKIYLIKTGQLVENIDNEYTRWGNRLEPVVAEEYQRQTGKTLAIVETAFIHPKHKFMRANIDRQIVGEKAILECKTTNAYLAKDWGEPGTDEIPQSYLLQCAHYAIVCDVERVDIAVLIGGNDFRIYHYYRNPDLESNIIKLEENFWNNHVLKRNPPPPTTKEESQKIWPLSDESKTKIASEEDLKLVDEYNTISKAIKELEAEKDKYAVEIYKLLEEASKLITSDGKKILTLNTQDTSRLDTKKIKEDLPDIYKQYCNTSQTRVLRVAK